MQRLLSDVTDKLREFGLAWKCSSLQSMDTGVAHYGADCASQVPTSMVHFKSEEEKSSRDHNCHVMFELVDKMEMLGHTMSVTGDTQTAVKH